MKPKLNKNDQKKLNKISRKLSLGQSLARLFGGAKEEPEPEEDPEEVPVFRTAGIIPRPGIRKPKIPPKPGKGRATVSNQGEEKMVEPRLAGVPLPPWHIVQEGDTLEAIAIDYGVTVKRLKKLNKLSDEQAAELKVGQKIRIY